MASWRRLLERHHGKGTFVRRPRLNSSLFRFFRFQSPSGERRVPESRILQREVLEAPSAVADALRLPAATPVIRITRLRLIDQNPVLAEEIWLPKDKFATILGLPSEEIGDLLYPAYEQYCGQVIASATETLTVEAVAGALCPAPASRMRLADHRHRTPRLWLRWPTA